IGLVGAAVSFNTMQQRTYFGGKLVGEGVPGGMASVVEDRLGSAGILSLWRGAECAAVGEGSGEVCDVYEGFGGGE
ncbi:MAG TPA: hypothetical protein VF146_01190, partial [Bryobacteraceae bacterium]